MDKSTPRPSECEHPDEMQAIVRTAAESGIYCRQCGLRLGDAPAVEPRAVNRDAAFDALVEALRPFANLGVGSGPGELQETYKIERNAIRAARTALALATKE